MASLADLQSLVLTTLDQQGSIPDSRNLSLSGAAIVNSSVGAQNELKAALASLESKEVRSPPFLPFLLPSSESFSFPSFRSSDEANLATLDTRR
jgi:hypothetical protein